ncbi:5-oxoprolinase subunit PxpB [Virgibacillus doumboii]|uniref:5-oxoprolinase subunit PxpB n=1 Tax=Virgibacillus doumboii TaxID=2697503 RepID=UPI0013E0E1C8|nr:5-oxoprolinase subunit PxpB [Virgibacillus doumboii]
MNYSLQAIGDAAIKIEFSDALLPELNREVQLFCRKMEECAPLPGMIEWVPAFDSVTIYYEPHSLSYQECCEKMHQIQQMTIEAAEIEPRCVSVPVLYGGDYGPDLERVAEVNGLTPDEVVSIHCEGDYSVYMLGFLPGFPYLGGLDKRIATPRLEEPRAKVAAGAVGIAHEQTGIYPLDSPGGWNIIGKTPLTLFERNREDTFLFRAGDRVRFYEVSEDELAAIGKGRVVNDGKTR